jgi:hypothetical protein
MSNFYDFGRFSEISEEKIKKDKELFFRFLVNMCVFLEYPLNLDGIEKKEVYLNNLLGKGTNINRVDFDFFLTPTGISYI